MQGTVCCRNTVVSNERELFWAGDKDMIMELAFTLSCASSLHKS